MPLNSAERVHFALGFKVSGMRLFWSCILPKVVAFPVDADLSKPRQRCSMFSFGNPKKPASAVGSTFAHVLLVFRFGCATQIGPSVVRSIPINVVNFVRRPFVSHVQPRKAMGFVGIAPNLDCSVPLNGFKSARHGVGVNRIGHSDAPRKNARFWIVMKKFAQTLRGKIGLSHDAVLSLIGQRPVSVSSTCGLRYFRLCAGFAQ